MRWLRHLFGEARPRRSSLPLAGAPDEATYQLGVMSVGLLAAEEAQEIIRSGNFDPEVEPEGRWRDRLIDEASLDDYATEHIEYLREMRDYHIDYNMKTKRPMPKDLWDLVNERAEYAHALRALLKANQAAMRARG
ncbi:MAG: hypothetical protein KF889_25545 [Alphaproteobacteria bacterium]|nr:hypothetical protein [Alphaproteobacteria bacterium]MCW5739640.1 hypothetical protein [Alphaproteobacteria bacterium]